MTSNTLTDREALYCLCHVPGFGGVTIRGLKDTFGTYLSAWRVKPQELQKSGDHECLLLANPENVFSRTNT